MMTDDRKKSKRRFEILTLVGCFVLLGGLYILGLRYENLRPFVSKCLAWYPCLLVLFSLVGILLKTKLKFSFKCAVVVWGGIGIVLMVLSVLGYSQFTVWLIPYALITVVFQVLLLMWKYL